MPTREEIHKQVTDVMVDALGVDPEEVTLDASLTSDLGAESIDFLDIVFRLEKAFGIKIPREELFPENLTYGADGFGTAVTCLAFKFLADLSLGNEAVASEEGFEP